MIILDGSLRYAARYRMRSLLLLGLMHFFSHRVNAQERALAKSTLVDLHSRFRDAVSLRQPIMAPFSCFAPLPIQPRDYRRLLILDVHGSVVRHTAEAPGDTLDTKGLPPGLYWLYVGDGPASLANSEPLFVRE